MVLSCSLYWVRAFHQYRWYQTFRRFQGQAVFPILDPYQRQGSEQVSSPRLAKVLRRRQAYRPLTSKFVASPAQLSLPQLVTLLLY